MQGVTNVNAHKMPISYFSVVRFASARDYTTTTSKIDDWNKIELDDVAATAAAAVDVPYQVGWNAWAVVTCVVYVLVSSTELICNCDFIRLAMRRQKLFNQ